MPREMAGDPDGFPRDHKETRDTSAILDTGIATPRVVMVF
jgi:hypothetical protein